VSARRHVVIVHGDMWDYPFAAGPPRDVKGGGTTRTRLTSRERRHLTRRAVEQWDITFDWSQP
jgi:hypothetical protein